MRAGRTTADSDRTTFALGDEWTIDRLGLGTMRMTGQPDTWGEPEDPDEARSALRRAVDLGVNLIDTADTYGPAVAERLIADALHPYPADLIIATKGGGVKARPGHAGADGRPEHLRRALESSLLRLRLDQIPLYQLHRVDPDVPLATSVQALARFRDEGLIRLIGLSNVSMQQLREALELAPIVSVQNEYSLIAPGDPALVDFCEASRIAYIAYKPLGVGRLTADDGSVARLAKRRGATAAQVALSWLLDQSRVTIPIPGAVSVAEVEENIGATAVRLSAEDLATLGSAFRSRGQER